DAVFPQVTPVRLRWSLFQLWGTDAAAITVVALLIPAGLAVAVGLWTRVATVLSFVLLLSIGRRDPYMMNSGDALLRHATLLLALTPAGAALSVDRWRRHPDRAWEIPHAAPWGLRLLQLQLVFVYLFSSFEKLRGVPWLDGTALADAWRITDLARFGIPLPVYDSLLMTNVLTYSTLVIEVALATLIWNRRARPYVLIAGVFLHLGIEATMAVGFFSTVAVTLYLAFVPAETFERWIEVARERLVRR
ncbi:MAG: HTTM domain-containing protein, partial [Nitriliruptor sp.]